MLLPDLPELPGLLSAAQISRTADSIEAVQRADGSIPWYAGGQLDPWDHVECAMGLAAAGRLSTARHAYDYLVATQRVDGSWPSRLRNGIVENADAETNQCAYLAVGIWHQLLISGDVDFARSCWPTVRRSLDFVCAAAIGRGEIGWVVSAEDGRVADEALLTGCSSTLQALRAGLALAERFDEPQPAWELTAGRLEHAIRAHPADFLDKQRFSMDWYYPIIGGAVRGSDGLALLKERWDDFVVPEIGARCVDDEPWVTGGETAELVIALDCLDDRDRAMQLLAEVQHLREPDGSYWTGYQFALRINWPDEHSTWTGAAMILAVDALSQATAGNGIFRGETLPPIVSLDEAACDEDCLAR